MSSVKFLLIFSLLGARKEANRRLLETDTWYQINYSFTTIGRSVKLSDMYVYV